jgi:competence protein ComEC
MAALANSDTSARDNLRNYILYKDAGKGSYMVKGLVLNNPVTQNGRTVFLFRVAEIQVNNLRHSCSGNILVRSAYPADWGYGRELILRGNIYRNRFCRRQVCALMRLKSPAQAVIFNRNKGTKLKTIAFWLKKKFEGLINRYFSGIPAAVIAAMVLGEGRNIPQPVYDAMMKSGTVHILVVSGFNTSIVAGMIILILKIIRLPRRPRILVAAFLLVIYCFIAGASTPVVRATVMALVFMLSYFFKREPGIYNSLALAAIFILIFDPRQLFNIGFQLSFVSVISIVYFYPRLSALLHTQSLKIKPLRLLIDAALVSLSAWLGTAAFIAYYFKIFSPVTVFANLIIVPLSSLITLCGFSTLISAALCPALAGLFASSSELLVLILLTVNNWLIKLPGAYFYLPGRG